MYRTFWYVLKIWNLVLWRDAGKKRLSCYVGSKNGAFIIRQSEKELKIQSHFGIFDPVIGEDQWYYDVAPQDPNQWNHSWIFLKA